MRQRQLRFTPTSELRKLVEAEAEAEGASVSTIIRRRLLAAYDLLPNTEQIKQRVIERAETTVIKEEQ